MSTGQPADGRSSSADPRALERAVLLGEKPAFDPFSGTDLASGAEVRRFRAAELGLEAPRFCQICGRRMVVQVDPMGWSARCSRHGELTSDVLARP